MSKILYPSPVILGEEPFYELEDITGFHFNKGEFVWDLALEKVYTIRDQAHCLLAYMMLDQYEDHQELLILDVREDLHYKGLGVYLMETYIDKTLPTYLMAFDPAAKAFFEHVSSEYGFNLEIEE